MLENLLTAEVCYENAVSAGIYLRKAGNRRYFSPKNGVFSFFLR